MPSEKSASGAGVQLSSTMVDHQSTNIPISAPAITTAAVVKSKENLYAESGIGKCYMCGEPEHKSNECPKKKHVNMSDY